MINQKTNQKTNHVLLNYSKQQPSRRETEPSGTVVYAVSRTGQIREAGYIALPVGEVMQQIIAARMFNAIALSAVWLGDNQIVVSTEHSWNANNRWAQADEMQLDSIDEGADMLVASTF